MTNLEKSKKFDMKYIHYGVTALIIFGSPFVPPISTITPMGMAVLGAFLGAVYGWTFLDMIWPSILGIIGLGLAVGMGPALAAGFGNPIVVMLFIVFGLMALLTETKVTEVIARSLLSNRLTLGRPWVFVFVFFASTAICCQLNVFVSIILFSSILLDLCKKLGYKPFSKFPAVMLMGIALSCQMGQIVIPFRSTGITLVGAFSAMTQEMPNFIEYMIFMIPMAFFMLFSYVLICRFIFRLDVKPLKNISEETLGKKEKLNRDQKIALIFLGLNILMLSSTSFLPKAWEITQWLVKLTMFGQAGVVICTLMLLKKEDGTKFFDFPSFASKGISWEAIFMTSFIMPMSNFLTAEGTGIKEFLVQILQPMTSLSPYIFIVAIMVFAALVTNLANNVVLAVMILPVVITFSGQMGLSPIAISCLLFVVTQLALFTPGASVFAGMVFSNTEWVEARTLMGIGLTAVLILVVLFLAVGIPYSMLVF